MTRRALFLVIAGLAVLAIVGIFVLSPISNSPEG
jgi:predicted MFS family arabinose efflux permease